MPAKKRFFTKNNKRVGKKSGKPRGKYNKQPLSVIEKEVPIQSQQIDKEKIIQFPNNYRSITEPFSAIHLGASGVSWRKALLIGFFALLIGVSLWQAALLVQSLLQVRTVWTGRQKLAGELTLWENVAAKYPSYRDAYFQSAILAYQLGDKQKEKEYLTKTLQLDPNFIPARQLEKIGE